MAGKRPVAAILYDFDRTLCTKDMQEYQFIPSVGMEPADFWGSPTATPRKSIWTKSCHICTS